MKLNIPRNYRLSMAAIFLGLVGSASAATYSVTMSTVDNPGNYQVHADLALSGKLGAYQSNLVTTNSAGETTFRTFCLQHDEYYSNNTPYDAEISDKIQSGNKPIAKGTAYLYQLFVSGGLDPKYYVAGSGASQLADELQNTIWNLQGFSTFGIEAGLKGILEGKFGTIAVSGQADNGEFGVQALNLTYLDANNVRQNAQDQLIYTGVKQPGGNAPDGGTTLVLLGLSLSGLGLARRFARS